MLFPIEIPGMVLWTAAIIASFTVLCGWIITVYFIIRNVNRKVKEITDHVYEEIGDLRYLIYGASVLFWPAALGFGIYYLSSGKDARVGRVCIFILLGIFTLCLLAATAIVMLGVAHFPEIVEYLLD
jgi:hypothetical protein